MNPQIESQPFTGMNQWKKIGDMVRERWSMVGRDECQFPAIAAQVLRDTKPGGSVDEILSGLLNVEGTLSTHQLPTQFGDFQYTLYKAPGFYIEMLLWSHGTTTIHDHGFSGAFYVFTGSSISSRYRYHQDVRVNSAFAVGSLQWENSSFLKQGDVQEIQAGTKLVHSVFHITEPTITIVIRTVQDLEALPQRNYVGHAIAVSIDVDSSFAKQIEVIKACVQHLPIEKASAILAELVPRMSGEELYWTCSLLDSESPLQANFTRSVHEHPLGKRILAAVQYEKELGEVASLRAMTSDARVRLFLALLLNVPDLRSMKHLVAQTGVSPGEWIASCFRSMIAEGWKIDHGALLDATTTCLAGDAELADQETDLGEDAHPVCLLLARRLQATRRVAIAR